MPREPDFGIAVLGNDLDATTRTHAFTPGYTAPEVLESPSRAGPASDTYSLAATLYHLLAGHPPFDLGPGEGISRLLRRIETEMPPDIARADLPLRLISILYRALAKQPDDRFATTAEFARSLRQVWTDHLTEQQNTTASLTSVPNTVANQTALSIPAPDLATLPPARIPQVGPPVAAPRPRGVKVRYLVAAAVSVALLAVVAATSWRPASTTNAWRPAPTRRLVTVPALSGLSRGNAVERLTQIGLTVGTTAYEPEAVVVAGEVVASSPAAGQAVPAGTAVNLVISAGPGKSAGAAPVPSPAPASVIAVSKGPPTTQSNCASPCNFLSISLTNFAADTTYTVSCETDSPPPSHPFFGFTAHTDAAGNYSARDSLCWFGRPGSKVWATAGGVTSNLVTW